ncbi:biotin synthase auxiliary protein BsaP [Micromonospora radicis]|uniref:Biotin synthase auxiliary protein n=1 Tax=Micromonospora radicis TaxID=1894971 RepID=A0A418MQ60_9ACTN|nr:hypothetical protein [Micromonospora radicis]RIV35567.1 hypothetical protein D2L64_21740 [Micromonospora radicis]
MRDAATRAGDRQPVPAGPWCDRCGEAAASGPHDGCAAARALEPPRYCAHCRRRMKVQVLPVGWSAICVEHGELRG